jgi:hypothetical protein
MLSGLIVFSIVVLLFCACLVIVFLRTPQCPKCRIPLQSVEERVRELGAYGLETVIDYECPDCYRDMRRVFNLTHMG